MDATLAIPFAIGLGMAVGVFLLGRWAGFDRDRAYYSTILIVIAGYYILFAAMSGSTRTLLSETLLFSVFGIAAVLGFRRSLWIVAVGLAGHGVMDLFHHHLIRNTGVPRWWPPFCAGFDVAAGALMAWLLTASRRTAPRDPGETARR